MPTWRLAPPTLHQKLYEGAPDLHQAYARLLLNEVVVTDRRIAITGSKAALREAPLTGWRKLLREFSLYVPKWCARQDSNLWPPD